jgi:AcrR family transcriptional regulator
MMYQCLQNSHALFVAPANPLADRGARAATPANPMRSDTRDRIVAAAQQLFRRFGHQKTTVMDIARALSMSPANVYRFFPSKGAINEAVCRRLLGDLISVAAELPHRNATAEDRLRALLVELARINVARSRTDKPLQQLLAVATGENWPAVTDHVERMESIVAAIIADGMQRGEFRNGDARRASRCVYTAMLRHVHPSLVVRDGPGQPSLREIVDFCLAALG